MKKIIVLSGKQYSGKDTVAKIIIEKFSNFKRIGIGDAIKIAYGKKHCLTFDEIEANKHIYRNSLIELGDWGRKQDADYWLKSIVNMESDIVVPDVRLVHEIELFKSYGAYSIRVEATEESRKLRGTITNADDLTECALDSYKNWSYVIDNSSDYNTLITRVEPLLFDIKLFYDL